MDISNYFYQEICAFGSYPSQEDIFQLEEAGFRLFINLTTIDENLIPYQSQYIQIKFPIKDRFIPNDNCKFTMLILYIEDFILNNKGKVYIHCKGGHGRSAMLAACLLCKIENLDHLQAIEKVSESHKTRKNLHLKYKNLVCPNSRIQKFYVKTLFQPLYFSKNLKNSEKNGLSNFSPHQVNIPGIGIFPNSESAYQALKNPKDLNYIQKLINAKNPKISVLLGEQYNDFDDEKKVYFMKQILTFKFLQNEDIRLKLLMTGFRPIINHNKYDNFWGDNGDGSGHNYLGKLLMKIREDFFRR